ncbi:MAG: CBS domain-containing protein [Candidatus Aminicenantes bacterium]|nr:CBS domain-containing protein [Candidatus Aminicenantes bacterium]
MQKLEAPFKDLQATNINTFLFFSEIQGRFVVDEDGTVVGKLADLKLRLGELFPTVATLVVKKRREKKLLELDWQEVQSLNTSMIRLNPGACKKFRPLEVNPQEILLRDELLDKQVVDTFGAKIERVNDIHLLIVNRDLRIVHVDYGIRGILRRLGWLKAIDFFTNWLFAYQFEEKMISWKYIQPLPSGPAKQNLKLNVTSRKIHEIHPSDLADIIEELDQISRSTVFRSLDLQTAALTLEEVDPKLQLRLIESAPVELVSDILEEMAPDEATDLLADLPEEKQQKLIRTMEKPSREAVEELLKFKEGTAGSIMTKDFLSVRKDKTIGDAVEEFRKTVYPLESISYIYVTDQDNRLVGVSTLRHLITCEKDATLGKLMNTHLVKVEPEDNVNTVASLFKKYKFMALPVVDKEDVLKGIITIQDIMQSQL